MPKENTHLYFAHSLPDRMPDGPMKNIIVENLSSFHLGSIAPDILFYARDRSLCRASEAMHGITGELTNRVIFALLDAGPSRRDLAFLAGFISHCVLDIFFHPLIYYLSGNYYDDDPEMVRQARYRHRYLETRLDMAIASPVTVAKNINPPDLEDLLYPQILQDLYGLEKPHLQETLKRQVKINRLFGSTLMYHIMAIVSRERENLGLFYADVPRGDRITNLTEIIEYRDVITGETRNASYRSLMEGAAGEAIVRIGAVLDYHGKIIGPDELRKIIPGESLDTGRVGLTARDIRYTMKGRR